MLEVNSPEADAENAAVLATFFKRIGLNPEQVIILVNNRRLIDSQLDAFGVETEIRSKVSNWIDRREKLTSDAWDAFGKEIGLSDKQISDLKSMLDDTDLWKQSDELPRFFAAIDALGLSEYFKFDPSIMRGLLYYTGTVFEAWEVGGDIRRSILGGGRYDNLLADVGGQPLSGVGFAMGDVVISLILEKYELLPKDLKVNPAAVLVTVFDEMRLLDSFKFAGELRRAGLSVVLYPEPVKIQKQFKYADKLGMKVAVVIGPDEAENGQVAIKNLENGDQVLVTREEAIKEIKKILNA
jgi:histidyl-tRNA synthetase